MTISWWGATDPGKSRENNEDAWRVEDSLHAAILADGLGGANCGEVGSALTVEGIVEYLRTPEDGRHLSRRFEDPLRRVERINAPGPATSQFSHWGCGPATRLEPSSKPICRLT